MKHVNMFYHFPPLIWLYLYSYTLYFEANIKTLMGWLVYWFVKSRLESILESKEIKLYILLLISMYWFMKSSIYGMSLSFLHGMKNEWISSEFKSGERKRFLFFFFLSLFTREDDRITHVLFINQSLSSLTSCYYLKCN